jgi:hypothetical protein
MRDSWFVQLTKCQSTDIIEEDEMGGECGTYGREEKCMKIFAEET